MELLARLRARIRATLLARALRRLRRLAVVRAIWWTFKWTGAAWVLSSIYVSAGNYYGYIPVTSLVIAVGSVWVSVKARVNALEAKANFDLAKAQSDLNAEQWRGKALLAERQVMEYEAALGIQQRFEGRVAEAKPPEPLTAESVAGVLDLVVDRIGTVVSKMPDAAGADELLGTAEVLAKLSRDLLRDVQVDRWKERAAKKYGEAFVESSRELLGNLRTVNATGAKGMSQAPRSVP